jgi:integral membrane protein
MTQLVKTKIGWLRILGFLEGTTLIILIFVAVPMKWIWNNPSLVKSLGPVHGTIFLLFVALLFAVAKQQNWHFKTTTWKLLLACFIPFGTFYVDSKILSKIE